MNSSSYHSKKKDIMSSIVKTDTKEVKQNVIAADKSDPKILSCSNGNKVKMAEKISVAAF
jgi:hypothetical protein